MEHLVHKGEKTLANPMPVIAAASIAVLLVAIAAMAFLLVGK